MNFGPKAVLGAGALAMLLAFGNVANAAPVSKCDGAKKKCIGKYVAAVMGCHAKAESKNLPVDPACLSKAVAKITGLGKGCFDKNEAKVPEDCSNEGGAAAELAAADAFILDVVTDVHPGYPAQTGVNKCGPARKKCVGKKAAGLTGCGAKESKDGIGDPACVPKIENKFDDPVALKGCDRTALAKNLDCLGGPPTSASLEAKVDAWNAGVDTRIEAPGAGPCGNGVIDVGEFCDPGNPNAPGSTCGPDFTCTGSCNCACPTKVTFAGDPFDPASVLDTGWTGISHRAPIISDGQVTVALSACSLGGTDRPCGTCTVTGPIANPDAGAGQLDNQRCSGNPSVRCTSAPGGGAGCGGPLGTCEWFFGGPLPLAAGGVTTCVFNQFNGPVTGTANVESGEAANSANLTARVYNGIAIDNPCARCNNDPIINDGLLQGTCTGGTRNGLGCDANGTVADRPDFGKTSLDCPLDVSVLIATLPIDLTNATDPVTKTLTASSPTCSGEAGERCLCGTCNNINQEPCDSNADCPPNGGPGVCQGLRCIGGTNAGAVCTNVSSCPMGQCNRPGEPTKPSACLDDTNTVNTLDCTDTIASGSATDGEGECTQGPVTTSCSVASNHAQRGCIVDGDCGGGVGTCEANNRQCFLTGDVPGGTGKDGSGTLIAVGMEDLPMADTSSPTLGAVFCVGPTGLGAVNNVAGLPGPGRVTIKGDAVGLP